MHEPSSHNGHFNLAQKCLEGDTGAIVLLQRTFGDQVLAFLRRAGAPEVEAREIVDRLWADCLVANSAGRVPLQSYNGTCSLQTWLNKVALNRLLSFKREQTRHTEITAPLDAADAAAGTEASLSYLMEERPARDEPLLRLMKEAVEAAFAACPAEDFVLLQLVHSGDLKLSELAKIFDCSQATISRQVDRAAREISASTLAHLHKADPWLEMQWQDFIELCRSETPSCFGF